MDPEIFPKKTEGQKRRVSGGESRNILGGILISIKVIKVYTHIHTMTFQAAFVKEKENETGIFFSEEKC